MRLKPRLPYLLASGALLQCLAAAALAAPAVSVSRHNDTYTVSANVEVRASLTLVWGVLTDFEHFTRFVPDMRLSRVISHDSNSIVVEQQGVADMLFFHRRINAVMAVDLQPQTTIRFRSISGNLRMMTGSWNITPTSTGCKLEYASVSVPDFWTPPFIAPLLVRTQVAEQINGVVAEIDRRSNEIAQHSGDASAPENLSHP